MPEFWVYDNAKDNYSCVHREKCPHCKEGFGKTDARVGPQDRWLPATDLQDARARVKALGRNGFECRVCEPALREIVAP